MFSQANRSGRGSRRIRWAMGLALASCLLVAPVASGQDQNRQARESLRDIEQTMRDQADAHEAEARELDQRARDLEQRAEGVRDKHEGTDLESASEKLAEDFEADASQMKREARHQRHVADQIDKVADSLAATREQLAEEAGIEVLSPSDLLGQVESEAEQLGLPDPETEQLLDLVEEVGVDREDWKSDSTIGRMDGLYILAQQLRNKARALEQAAEAERAEAAEADDVLEKIRHTERAASAEARAERKRTIADRFYREAESLRQQFQQEEDDSTSSAESGPDWDPKDYATFDPSFFFEGGPTGIDAPQTSVGTAGFGGNEMPLGTSEQDLSGYTIGGEITLDSPRHDDGGGLFADHLPDQANWMGYLGGSYTEADGDSSDVLQAGGKDLAFTYERQAPNGSTGLNFGNGGGVAEIETEYERFDLRGGVYLEALPLWNESTTLRLGGGIRGGGEMVEHTGRVRSTQFPNSRMWTLHDLSSYRVGPELTVGITTRVRDTGVSLFAGVSLYPHYYDHELEYHQRTDVPVAPAPEQQLNFERDDAENGFGVGLGFEAGIEYKLADNISLRAMGYGDWTSDAPEAETKISPNDGPTQLSSDDQFTFGGMFRVQFSF